MDFMDRILVGWLRSGRAPRVRLEHPSKTSKSIGDKIRTRLMHCQEGKQFSRFGV